MKTYYIFYNEKIDADFTSYSDAIEHALDCSDSFSNDFTGILTLDIETGFAKFDKAEDIPQAEIDEVYCEIQGDTEHQNECQQMWRE